MIESQSELNRIYETSGPTPSTKDLQLKVDEHVKNIARLEGQEESLRAEIPPRPLPQPESVRVSKSFGFYTIFIIYFIVILFIIFEIIIKKFIYKLSICN